MTGPLNGIGGQQQYTAATSSQQNQSKPDIRQNDETAPRENTVQPKNAAASESQESETRNRDSNNRLETENIKPSGHERRGSFVDITV